MCPTKSLISLHFLGVVYHNSDDEAIYDRISVECLMQMRSVLRWGLETGGGGTANWAGSRVVDWSGSWVVVSRVPPVADWRGDWGKRGGRGGRGTGEGGVWGGGESGVVLAIIFHPLHCIVD